MPFALVFTVFLALAEATASIGSAHGAAAAAVVVGDSAAVVVVAVVVIVAIAVGCC